LLAVSAALSASVAIAGEDWSGPYVGVNAGWAAYRPDFGDNGYGSSPTDHNGDETGSTKHPLLLGGQIGWNSQRGRMVYGLEADYTNADGDASEGGDGVCRGRACGGGYAYRSELQSMYSLRARLGLAVGKALVYGTAGFGRIKATHDYFDAQPYGQNKLKTNVLVMGLGAEYKLSQHWSTRLEGLYYFAREHDVPTTDNFGERYSLTPNTGAVRVGLNYKF